MTMTEPFSTIKSILIHLHNIKDGVMCSCDCHVTLVA